MANIPFDLCRQLSWMTCLAVLEGILRLFLTVGSKFYWDKTCFFRHLRHYKLHWNYITWSVMPKPVSLLTVQEAHKEYSSLTDQIRAKYEQLDSGELGHLAPQHLMLKPMNWLIYLLVWANCVKDWTCQCQRNCTGPHSSSIEDTFGSKFTQAGSLG